MFNRALLSIATVFLCAGTLVAETAGKLPQAQPFQDAFDSETFPAANAPEVAPTFAWNFATREDYRYFYSQQTENRVATTTFGDLAQSLSVIGDLYVQAGGGHQAQVSFGKADIRASKSTRGGRPELSHATTEPAPIGMLNEDGYFEAQAQGQGPFVKLLFPAVARTIAIGQSVDVPLELEFTLIGIDIPVKGVSRITNTGYVMFNSQLCARLQHEMIVAKTTVPGGAYEFEARGKAISLFAIAQRRFVKATATMSVSLVATPSAGPSVVTTRVQSDNLVKVVAR